MWKEYYQSRKNAECVGQTNKNNKENIPYNESKQINGTSEVYTILDMECYRTFYHAINLKYVQTFH